MFTPCFHCSHVAKNQFFLALKSKISGHVNLHQSLVQPMLCWPMSSSTWVFRADVPSMAAVMELEEWHLTFSSQTCFSSLQATTASYTAHNSLLSSLPFFLLASLQCLKASTQSQEMSLSGGWPIVLNPNELLIKGTLPVLPSSAALTIAQIPKSIPAD